MNLWRRLEAMCLKIFPDVEGAGGLKPSLGIERLAAAQSLLPFTLPDDLREAYLAFNGMGVEGETQAPLLLGGYTWLGLSDGTEYNPQLSELKVIDLCRKDAVKTQPGYVVDIRRHRRHIDRTGGAVYEDFFHPTRILVGSAFSMGRIYVDTAPPPGGKVGQLIYSSHDSSIFKVIAPSFSAGIEKIVSAYEAGQITYVTDCGWTDSRGQPVRPTHLCDL